STVACVQRERSNSPLQALTLLNDPVFFECAQTLGWQLAAGTQRSDEERLNEAFRRCLGRSPRPQELARLTQLLESRRERLAKDSQAAKAVVGKQAAGPSSRSEAKADSPSIADQAAWVLVARVMMNLDEFITRE